MWVDYMCIHYSATALKKKMGQKINKTIWLSFKRIYHVGVLFKLMKLILNIKALE